MAAVRRVVRLGGGWLAAALAATTVSWAAIRGIVDDPLPGGSLGTFAVAPTPAATPPGTPLPPAPATTTADRSRPATTTSSARTRGTPARTTQAPGSTRGTTRGTTTGATGAGGTTGGTATAGQLRTVDTTGGRVVLELLADEARIVSVVPAPGFQPQTWQADGWLRVDLVSPADRSSVIVTWNGQPPQVQTIEY
jgi:hypothetical protein